jgi:hypothetical protein
MPNEIGKIRTQVDLEKSNMRTPKIYQTPAYCKKKQKKKFDFINGSFMS